jgi:hypothetical protein
VVVGSSAGTAAITFSGVTTNLQVFPGGTPHVPVGEFRTFPSAGFSFPIIPTQADILHFQFQIIETSPVPSVTTATWDFGGNGDLRAATNQIDIPIGPQPPGVHYLSFGFKIETWPFSLPGDGDWNVPAESEGFIYAPAWRQSTERLRPSSTALRALCEDTSAGRSTGGCGMRIACPGSAQVRPSRGFSAILCGEG